MQIELSHHSVSGTMTYNFRHIIQELAKQLKFRIVCDSSDRIFLSYFVTNALKNTFSEKPWMGNELWT